ncbi:hypothetical protein [Metabacillus idriensis]|uniref:hypothetical protein n=1 Tax=Metabacillus idriensis TaxID=324768 RepID=UPI00174B7991|nr:hypothetical protein [Metabacillus idriensis]
MFTFSKKRAISAKRKQKRPKLTLKIRAEKSKFAIYAKAMLKDGLLKKLTRQNEYRQST